MASAICEEKEMIRFSSKTWIQKIHLKTSTIYLSDYPTLTMILQRKKAPYPNFDTANRKTPPDLRKKEDLTDEEKDDLLSIQKIELPQRIPSMKPQKINTYQGAAHNGRKRSS